MLFRSRIPRDLRLIINPMKTTWNRATSSLAALTIISSLALCTVARAGFANGGFETGDFTGWTVVSGYNNGYGGGDPMNGVTWNPVGWGTPIAVVVDKASSDGYVPNFSSVFIGDKMAKINDIDGNNHVTQISQVGTIDEADLNGGSSASLYINWISVMDNPDHTPGDNPWFNITVTKDDIPIYDVTHISTEAGWTSVGSYGWDPVYQGAGQASLSGLAVGNVIGVKMTVADCSWGGHGAYAYLDGIGTAYVAPPTSVPENSATLGLVALALAAMALLRRRRN